MIDDPYQVLGISPSASIEEIKKAYRHKAREYHPDLHPNDPAAAKKMTEVNDAYDMLANPQKYAARSATNPRSGAGSSGGGHHTYSTNGRQNSYGFTCDFSDFDWFFGSGFDETYRAGTRPREEASDGREVRYVISAIQAGRFQDAISTLLRIPSVERNARWHYLLSLAYHGTGEGTKAIDEMQRAVKMEPENRTYSALLRQFLNAERSGGFDVETMRAAHSPLVSFGRFIAGILAARFFFGILQTLIYMAYYGLFQ